MDGVKEMEGKQVVIKIAAVCGSLRKSSFHRGLIRYAIEFCEKRIAEGLEIELLEISNLPTINTDLEVNCKFPAVVEDFRKKVLEADAFLFASPEYNYSDTPSSSLLRNSTVMAT